MSKKMMAARRGESGFTLIELLVVIVILGILSAVVVFAVRGTGDKGRSAAYATDTKTLRTAEEAFCAQNGFYASTQAQLVNAKFLSEPGTLHTIENAGVTGPCGNGTNGPSGYRIVCGTNGSSPPSGCGDAGEIVRGGTLVINNGSAVPAASLNPAINSAGGIHSNSEDMFNGLLRYELDGSIGGDLAQTFDFNNAVPSASNPNCSSTGNTGGATPVSCDATTTVATFVLRPNVKFHGKVATPPVAGDGDILTADDVLFSFSRAILAAHGRTRAINTPLGVIGANFTTSVPTMAIQAFPATAGNGGTVKFNFRQVFAPLKYTLNVTEAPILSKSAYDPCWTAGTLFSVSPPNACPANTAPVGTGPFRFQSLDTTGITTVRNPDYFRTGLPYFDTLVKKVVTGSPATSLIGGAVDVAAIANNERPLLSGNPNFVLSQTPRGSGGGNCITTIAFNTTKREAGAGTVAPAGPYAVTSPHYGQGKPNDQTNAEPHQILGDSRVREAIFKSLDRNKFWTDIAFSAGRVADAPVHSIFQPNGAYQGPQALPTFDRTAAGALLDAAGWSDKTNPDGFRRALNHPYKDLPSIPNGDPELQVPDGTKLSLEYLAATGNEPYKDEVKSELATVGIDVTGVIGDNSLVVAPRIFNARTFDMGQISYCNNDEPQFGVRRQYHTDQLLVTNAFTNASGYKSLMMDQLWLDASKAPDVATYQAKFLQIQRLALGLSTPGGPTPGALEIAQKFPMVQLLESAGTRGTLARCTGFNNNNTGLYMEATSCRR